MKTRKAYDSAVVFLYATGREHLLPMKFRRKIPYATIHGWRHADYSRYLGHEFRHFFDHAFNSMELHAEYGKAKQSLWGAARSWFHLRELLLPFIKDAGNDKSTQKKVLSAIRSIKDSFGLKRTLKLFGISHALYRQWMIESQFDCFDSFTAICTKRHPHQLSLIESRWDHILASPFIMQFNSI